MPDWNEWPFNRIDKYNKEDIISGNEIGYGIIWGSENVTTSPDAVSAKCIKYRDAIWKQKHSEQMMMNCSADNQYKLTVYIPQELHQQIREMKMDHKILSFSWLVTEAVIEYLNNRNQI